MIEKKICTCCKKKFIPNHSNQKYCCKECSKEMNRQNNQRYYAEIGKYKEKEKRHPKKKKSLSISEIEKMAREAGMSYGMYIAKMGV